MSARNWKDFGGYAFLYQDERLIGQVMKSGCCNWVIEDRRELAPNVKALAKRLPGVYPTLADAKNSLEYYFDHNPIEEKQ